MGVYAASSPGRIDIIDGEMRYDVAYNWLLHGRPVVGDTWVGPLMSVPGRDGLRYSFYGPAGSVLGIPLVWLGLHTGAAPVPASQFLFSFTSAILCAGVAPLLFLFYWELGIGTGKALAWTLVNSLATLLWPAASSTFDNAQHAFFAFAAMYLAFLAARRRSRGLALLGGMLAGVLYLYQEYLLLLVPGLAFATLEGASGSMSLPDAALSDGGLLAVLKRNLKGLGAFLRAVAESSSETGDSRARYGLFLAGAMAGVALSFAYNFLRFGSVLDSGKFRFVAQRSHPLLGNPLAGLLTLLVSPGKGIFFYSPLVLLGILGLGVLWNKKPELVCGIIAVSLLLVAFISCFSFAGGDWCWGPRYLCPLLPLCALGFPFIESHNVRRKLVVALVAIGFVVQLLALSVENQRFFFERGLKDFFWAEDPWFYFKHSALIARVGEVLSLRHGLPPTAQYFNPIPMPNLTTYSLLGPPPNVPRRLSPEWMRYFQIFYLPRPWPLWMSLISRELRAINVSEWLAGLSCTVLTGLALIYRGFRTDERA